MSVCRTTVYIGITVPAAPSTLIKNYPYALRVHCWGPSYRYTGICIYQYMNRFWCSWLLPIKGHFVPNSLPVPVDWLPSQPCLYYILVLVYTAILLSISFYPRSIGHCFNSLRGNTFVRECLPFRERRTKMVDEEVIDSRNEAADLRRDDRIQ